MAFNSCPKCMYVFTAHASGAASSAAGGEGMYSGRRCAYVRARRAAPQARAPGAVKRQLPDLPSPSCLRNATALHCARVPLLLIHTVQNQPWQRFELFLLDRGCTPGTAFMLAKHANVAAGSGRRPRLAARPVSRHMIAQRRCTVCAAQQVRRGCPFGSSAAPQQRQSSAEQLQSGSGHAPWNRTQPGRAGRLAMHNAANLRVRLTPRARMRRCAAHAGVEAAGAGDDAGRAQDSDPAAHHQVGAPWRRVTARLVAVALDSVEPAFRCQRATHATAAGRRRRCAAAASPAGLASGRPAPRRRDAPRCANAARQTLPDARKTPRPTPPHRLSPAAHNCTLCPHPRASASAPQAQRRG